MERATLNSTQEPRAVSPQILMSQQSNLQTNCLKTDENLTVIQQHHLQRPSSTSAGTQNLQHTRKIKATNSHNFFSPSKLQQKQQVNLSDHQTGASTLAGQQQPFSEQELLSKRNPTIKDYLTELTKKQTQLTLSAGSTAGPTLLQPQHQKPYQSDKISVMTAPASIPVIDERDIRQISLFEIYVPRCAVDKDDQQMHQFATFIQKGYLKQAESVLNSVQKHQGYVFNLGLLKLLENKPKEAHQILVSTYPECKNLLLAKKQLD